MTKRIIKRYEYILENLLFEDENMKLYLARRKDRLLSFREYLNESTYLSDLDKYRRLQKAGINVPKLIGFDRQLLILIFERFFEPTALEVLEKEDLKEIYFRQLFSIYRFCRFSQIEINYFPHNFILKGMTLYYIGDDIFEADPKINLENYGLRYWIYSEEASKLLDEKGYSVNPKRILSEEETNKQIVLLSVTYW
ncbi:MAG: hypothetical protein WCZ47_02165 [Bacilli bacterium]|jgi:hypothetical protein|nr:hypothetical protein [Bacilli bacterium]NLN80176.1 hypothetical protein [Erysipelotrichia bacterium]